jgi:hypothetical protein
MEKVLKKVVLPPNSAVVVSMKQFMWITAVGSIAENLPQKVELSVISKLNKKPIALVDVFSKKDLTNDEKTFVRDIIKPKVDRIATSLLEMSFKLILKDRMLQENSLSENELFERFPNLPQWVVMFNNSSEDIEVEIPEKFVLPKIVSASLV